MKLNIVPASAGVQWVKLGLRAFLRQPLALTGLFFLFVAVMNVISLLPWIGSLLVLGLLPAATLGFMAATREVSSGKFPMPWILASALRAGRMQLRSMLVLGALYAALFLLVMGASALADGGQFARLYLGLGELSRDVLMQPEVQWAMWIAMGLSLPLSLLFWHAPALVHWHGVTPVKALFFSLVACVRNWGAYLVFGLTWFTLFLGAIFLAISVTGLLSGVDNAGLSVMPAAMMVTTLFFTSLYFTFADSFISTPEVPPP